MHRGGRPALGSTAAVVCTQNGKRCTIAHKYSKVEYQLPVVSTGCPGHTGSAGVDLHNLNLDPVVEMYGSLNKVATGQVSSRFSLGA